MLKSGSLQQHATATGEEGRRRDIAVLCAWPRHGTRCRAVPCVADATRALPSFSRGGALLWPSGAVGRRWQLAAGTWAGRVDDRMPMQARLLLGRGL